MDAIAKEVIRRFDRLQTTRRDYENAWQEIRELVLPHHSDFQRKFPIGDIRSTAIFDGTAVDAAEELANEITTNTTSATDRWFSLEVTDDVEGLNQDPDVIGWLEAVADSIYTQYSHPASKFYQTIYEANQELVGFGTSIINQEWVDGHLLFRAFPLADCYLDQNSKNQIDTVYRCLEYDSRQLIQEFPDSPLPEQVYDDKDGAKTWEVIHGVYPRRDKYNESSKGKPFASCWVLKEKGLTLKESGYNSLPYHVARWTTLSGEVYGRGPAIKCLPDIRMLNRMEYTIIKAAQKRTDPALFALNDGYLGPIKTAPGSINFIESMDALPRVVDVNGDLPFAEDKSEQKRQAIRRAFYGEWVKWNQKTERQSAYEISELVDQQLRKMGGIVGRLQGETHGPLIERSYELMMERQKFPQAPPMLQGREIKIVYVSAAARAQMGTKLASMNRWLQNIIPIAQAKPEIMDVINASGWASAAARYTGVPRGVINSPEQVQQIQADREQQAQLQQIAGAAEPASKAIKNLAEAQQMGNIAL
jgi:hypothetical protein